MVLILFFQLHQRAVAEAVQLTLKIQILAAVVAADKVIMLA